MGQSPLLFRRKTYNAKRGRWAAGEMKMGTMKMGTVLISEKQNRPQLIAKNRKIWHERNATMVFPFDFVCLVWL